MFLEALEIFLVDQSALLIGDFNLSTFNTLSTTCSKVNSLRTFCDSLQLTQRNSTGNLNNRQLDLIFSNLRKIQVKREENPFVPENPCHPTLLITVEFLFQPETVPFPTLCTL